MGTLFKYILWLLSLFFLIVYYLLGTTLGQKNVASMVENHYSEKLDNKLEVLSFNIDNYPFIMAELRINDTTLLSLEGNSDEKDMNISYHLRGETFKWSDYDISHPINLKGRVRGERSELLVNGEGEAFYGATNYLFFVKENHVKDLELHLNNVSSKELITFLDYDIDLEGDIDVLMQFEYFSSFRKKGSSKINMKKARIPKFSEVAEFTLDGKIVYKDLLREFFLDIGSKIGELHIANGQYNKAAELMEAQYSLNMNELSDFETLLKHKYKGVFNTTGNVKYESKKLSLLGESNSFGGLLSYNYSNDYLDLEFEGVTLEKVLEQLSYPALLSAKLDGTASYDLENEIILVNTKLKETRFRRTHMTDKIYEMTDIDILKDVYNDSIFTAGYQDSILTSLLQIDNGVNHLYLKDTRMNSKTNEITADFEVRIDEQEFAGEIYGTLEDPKVDLDMTKLIKYQINKKIDRLFRMGSPF